ncbi:MAG: nitrilase-related carbon-nitrogen hydrolase, partial [Cyanobacteria bacterium J06641_5]
MKPYLAAAIQMTSTPDLATNLAEAEDLIDLAVRRGAKLVSLPENFPFLGEEVDKLAQAEEIGSRSEKFLKIVAQRYQITLLGGGFPLRVPEGDKVHNTALLIDPNGREVARY